ncbi:MFS transporter [Nonomuraea roseoviolacea]|uniref:MFS family arabinose efflux permease n=1 Tax=Nonomuraea roseoviolacea subsp. carminata TaxID=160689 RepID=A0ABT1JX28_9ACTN|nr:MFS transporter [Nonomuraea roseoviolacea]MCP2346150.1 putative MFS family arabinose efflux permease [Nonomuraea roseoviolacea subsp. carminata]
MLIASKAGPPAARYRDVLANREFRAVFAADLLSMAGDYLAKIAIAVLVFENTASALLSAVAFGIGYLPGVLGGPVLAALSDRLPRRTVMVTCDVARAVLVGALAVPGVPVPALLVILFAASLFAPPFQAARSAILPEVLAGDAYAVAGSLMVLSQQLAQVLSFAAGGALLTVVGSREALLLDALSFVASALLVRTSLTHRPAPRADRPRGWLSGVGEGFRLVFHDRALRTCLLLAWAGAAATAAPEGLMSAYAESLHGSPATTGLLLAAIPVGNVAGAVLYVRFTPPRLRERLVAPMALGAVLALLPIGAGLPLPAVLGLLALSGFGLSHVVVLNTMFTRAVPAAYRGRANGLAVAGLMVGQGGGVALAGAAADALGEPGVVITLCGAAGLVAVGSVLVLAGPRAHLTTTLENL